MTSTYLDKGKGRARDADDGPATAPWLANLNDAQREAVTWSAKGGLQILAGPGSGTYEVIATQSRIDLTGLCCCAAQGKPAC